MPRPTAAQFAYGSATVVFSTLALLLLSQTASGIGVAIIALAALALGVLVSLTVPMPKTARTVHRTNDAAVSGTTGAATADASTDSAGSDAAEARVPGPRTVSSRAHSAVGGHSLRG
ncbi:hypothetical protein J7E91_32030 [Streptomyces sp. ISL-99]|uniref:hypothetical protein n=1 Tax=Streptomyces sp. ISL-99 TaxID=2819193 RepID=UPI001BE4FC39|nr:hypothetical protein [Streptomyces sp. ISL-99]MBT2529868.1 hypothetical protein [Streptomyces sp. ISL-99]